MSEYLAIKNWAEFQSPRRRFDWIRDYPTQVSDEDYCKLTFFQRQVLQELRRLRGRLGKNIPYDLHYICRETAATVPDKPRINAALTRLLHDGWLILTNQQVDFVENAQNKKEKEINKEKKPSRQQKPPADPRYQEFVDVLDRYWKKFVSPAMTFADWFGKLGGHNLKALLKQRESLTVQQFEQWMFNRARSPGVKHSQPVNEWICHVTDYAEGPKGAANGSGTNKAQQREARQIEQLRRVAGTVANNLPVQPALPSGDGRPGAGGLAGNIEPLPAARSPSGNEPLAAQSAKAGST